MPDPRRIVSAEVDWRWINLSHRQDRRDYMEGVLGKAGLRAERFEAFRKEDWPGAMPPKMAATPNTLGNFLSHVALMDLAAATGRVVGVLEDDVVLCSDLAERLDYVARVFDREWDLFFLGATYHVNPPVWHKATLGRDFELTGVRHIHRTYGCWSNYAYLVNPDRAARLAGLMRAGMAETAGSDTLLIELQREQIACYSFTPGAAFQADMQSDIGRGVTVFSHFRQSLGPYVYAERLGDFDYDAYDWAEGRRP